MMKKTTKRIIGLFFGIAFLLSISFPALATYTHFESGVVSETGFYVGAYGTETEVIDADGNFTIVDAEITAADIGTLSLDGTEVEATADEINTLADGSNADSLHSHAFLTWVMTAGETITPGLLCYLSSGDVMVAEANSAVVIGANVGIQAEDTDPISLGLGIITAVADGKIEAGYQLKAADGGKVIRFVDADLAGDTMGSGTGGNFANQPANDAVEVVSSEAADTTQVITIYGTTNGGDGTVVTENITLTGTTEATTTKVDWGLILGVEMNAVATGTVTIREASGDKTITTIAPAATSAGVIAVATETRAFNQKPVIVADDATTKSVAVIGTANDHSAQTEKATALTGSTPVTLANEYNTVTKMLVGDVDSARTVTLKVGAANNSNLSVGKSLEAAAAEDDEILILLFFN